MTWKLRKWLSFLSRLGTGQPSSVVDGGCFFVWVGDTALGDGTLGCGIHAGSLLLSSFCSGLWRLKALSLPLCSALLWIVAFRSSLFATFIGSTLNYGV